MKMPKLLPVLKTAMSSSGLRSGVKIKEMGALSEAYTRMQDKLYQPPKTQIKTIEPGAWPSPLQPVPPLGPKDSQPLLFPYNIGQNLNYTPRSDAEYSSADLRALGTYPLARICIENIKDFVTKTPWSFQVKPEPGETPKQRDKRGRGDDILLKLSKFFEYPDGVNDWTTWIRPLIEDELVLDAPTVFIQRTKDGYVEALEVLRGDDIVCYLDDRGRIPAHPDPAYAQIYNGVPRVDLTTHQLVYRPRNIVPRQSISSNIYGMSVVEQLADEIKPGALRLRSVLAYYEDGSVPGLVHVVPSDIPADKIVEHMKLLNSQLAGQLKKRRQWQMVQGFRTAEEGFDQIMTLQDPVLADAFDELHIRKMTFGFGVSPQRLVRQMNRASAEQAQESSEEEGTLVWLDWVSDYINYIIQMVMGYTDYEIVLQPEVETDPETKAVTTTTRIHNAQMTINEGRIEEGLDPDPSSRANKLGFMTGNGFMTLEEMDAQMEHLKLQNEQSLETAKLQAAAALNPQSGFGFQGGGQQGGQSSGKESKTPPAGGKESGDEEDEPETATHSAVAKFDPSQPRDGDGRWSNTGGGSASPSRASGSRISPRVMASRSTPVLSRQERAKLTFKPSTRAKQILADHSEKRLSTRLGLTRSGNNSPFDLVGKNIAVEVKTVTDNNNNKITVHPDALRRKQSYAVNNQIKPFTVVIDRRESPPVYYVREGVGSFYIKNMERMSFPQIKKKLLQYSPR